MCQIDTLLKPASINTCICHPITSIYQTFILNENLIIYALAKSLVFGHSDAVLIEWIMGVSQPFQQYFGYIMEETWITKRKPVAVTDKVYHITLYIHNFSAISYFMTTRLVYEE